jgi:hypothetical protein
MKKALKATLMLTFAAAVYAGCNAVGYVGQFANVTTYGVSPSDRTPEGVVVDASGFKVDLAAIDSHIDKVEQCLRDKYPDGSLPADVVKNGHCLSDKFDPVIQRSFLTVKVAPDWHNGCLNEQVFPCGVDPKYCEAKGITPTPECPCECRGAVQDNDTIVTTPDLHLFDNDLIRVVTTCNYIWIAGLQECFAP